jgi:hypothetical protein
MRGRVLRLTVAAALMVGAFAALSVPVAGADSGDHPVGYTIGTRGAGAGESIFCAFYKIDLETGAATVVNPNVNCGDGLTFDDDGTLYAYVSTPTAGAPGGAQLVTIDKHTGVQHVVGQLPHVLTGGGGMTFDAEGHLWLYALTVGDPSCQPAGTFCLFEVNKKTAATRFVGTAPVDRGVYGLAADCEDVLAITAAALTGAGTSKIVLNPALNEVDTHNGSLHNTVPTPGIVFPTGLDFDSEGDLWALANTNLRGAGLGMEVFKVDPNTGNTGGTDVTLNGAPFVGNMNGLGVSPIGDCEPDTTTTTTTPAAPVVAAQPNFTG